MAVSGLGTTWNLPNYAGELFTADTSQTPFLTMAGGLTGGMMTDNFEFPTAILFDMPDTTGLLPALERPSSRSAAMVSSRSNMRTVKPAAASKKESWPRPAVQSMAVGDCVPLTFAAFTSNSC